MKTKEKRVCLFILLALCVTLFAGCAAKGCYISRYDVKEMTRVLENPCRKYTIEDCFAASTVLEEYFDGGDVGTAEARNAFNVMNTYMESMIDAEDLVLGILVNLE